MLETIQSQDYAIDSVLVVRNGVLVLDSYTHPADATTRHIIHSCTKSVVSALIGIAIEQGHIRGVETPIVEIFADRQVANLEKNKEAMTLEDLLTMSTGLRCEDSYLHRWKGLDELRASSDWVQFVLDLPMSEQPGTRFEYCNGASFLLSAIIQGTTGTSSLEFAREHLFGPLGIEDVQWPTNPAGINIGWGELHMRPRDMAKIGLLYLYEGRWDGTQVVPTQWVKESTRMQVRAGTLQQGYGYQWWIAEQDIYMALGYAGQYIVVVPDEEMVVVFTSSLSEREFYAPWELLQEYILPAAASPKPLPSNNKGTSRLQQAIDSLASR
jgi:CubicO group peptidase (beta-lactamase class C family)